MRDAKQLAFPEAATTGPDLRPIRERRYEDAPGVDPQKALIVGVCFLAAAAIVVAGIILNLAGVWS